MTCLSLNSQITTDKRVGHRWGDGLDDEAPLGSSLNEEEFCKFVQVTRTHVRTNPPLQKKFCFTSMPSLALLRFFQLRLIVRDLQSCSM